MIGTGGAIREAIGKASSAANPAASST